jgi:hypothetical protein
MSGRVDGKPFLRTWTSAAGSGTPFALRGSDFWTVMMKVRVEKTTFYESGVDPG